MLWQAAQTCLYTSYPRRMLQCKQYTQQWTEQKQEIALWGTDSYLSNRRENGTLHQRNGIDTV